MQSTETVTDAGGEVSEDAVETTRGMQRMARTLKPSSRLL